MKFDQKILIVRFSSIGDIVQSTSPLKTIRNAFPDFRITFLTLSSYAPLLEMHPDIDSLLFIKRKQSLKKLLEVRKYLLEERFQFIYDLHNSIRSNILTYGISKKIYRIKKPRLKRFGLFFFHINKFDKGFSSLRLFHDNLGSIWNDNGEIPPTYLKISKFEKEQAHRVLISQGVKSHFIAVVPGAAWNQKQWSSKNYISTLNELNLPAVILGSKKDEICNEISLGYKKAINLAGKTDLRLAISIISNAKKILGSDTGLVHAGEALGKTVIMIMGPTSKETGGGTYKKKSTILEKDLWCRPCSQNGKFPCYRSSQKCMDSILPKDVVSAFLRSDKF
ncbi:MAG: glycosyltransferase family 9 protein [Candidatus Neomarinimicrobiota bacterium]